jgi:hypothetical protein
MNSQKDSIKKQKKDSDFIEFLEGKDEDYKKRLSEIFGFPIRSREVRNIIPEEIYNKLVEEPMTGKLLIFEKYKVINEIWGTWVFDVASSFDKLSNLESLIRKNIYVAPILDTNKTNRIDSKGIKLHEKYPEIDKLILTAYNTEPEIWEFLERSDPWKSTFTPGGYIVLY